MSEVELQVVGGAEGLRPDALRHERVHVVIVLRVLPEEAHSDGALALSSDSKL